MKCIVSIGCESYAFSDVLIYIFPFKKGTKNIVYTTSKLIHISNTCISTDICTSRLCFAHLERRAGPDTTRVPREKGRDQSRSYDKSPYTHKKIQKATWQHKNVTKNFDYTTITDRLRTVSKGSDSHPTGVVKFVYGISTFQLTAKAVQSNLRIRYGED